MLLDALSCKIQRPPPAFGVELIQHLHQLLAASTWGIVIKQVKLCDTLAKEIPEHNASLLVAVPILPDFVQALNNSVDDVAGIMSGCEKLH